jgi:glutamate N-acetyltransferase/amino-acid N-acetyltransferase
MRALPLGADHAERSRSHEEHPTMAQSPSTPFDLAPGFSAAAAACGLKENGALDVALVVAARPCAAAGVFTTNFVKAAPVLVDREVLATSASSIRAVIANSGCANACTGEIGMRDARAMAALTADGIGCGADQVLVLSTGVIGRPLPMEKLARGIREVTGSHSPTRALEAARAIMTTDTRPKTAAIDARIAVSSAHEAARVGGGERHAAAHEAGDGPIAIRGFAKGSGMIHPALATMLAIVTTDADVEPALLDRALRRAVERSFNRVSVDGDMSTNDTVLLLASGASGVRIGGEELDAFVAPLTEVCGSLARQIARDGEGATRLVEIIVGGARDEREAHAIADAIARSPLVKTAIHGGDPNWGRVLAAAGACGIEIDPDRIGLEFGHASAPIALVKRGLPLAFDADAASRLLREDPVEIRLDLGLGAASATVWTCDLSAEYVAVNAHYTT